MQKRKRKKRLTSSPNLCGEELDRHEKAHKELCEKEADRMGEGEDDGKSEEEKALADFVAKAGRAISAKNKEKLKAILEKMESHHNEITAAIKELMGSESDGGEETEPDKKSAPAPEIKVEHLGSKSELESYLFTQRLVRQVKTASEGALRQINEKIKETRSSR